MAYSQTLLGRYDVGGGFIEEFYSFDADSVTTSGAQTPDTNDVEGIGKIRKIQSVIMNPGATGCFSTLAATRASHTITCTSGDTGFYTLRGRRG